MPRPQRLSNGDPSLTLPFLQKRKRTSPLETTTNTTATSLPWSLGTVGRWGVRYPKTGNPCTTQDKVYTGRHTRARTHTNVHTRTRTRTRTHTCISKCTHIYACTCQIHEPSVILGSSHLLTHRVRGPPAISRSLHPHHWVSRQESVSLHPRVPSLPDRRIAHPSGPSSHWNGRPDRRQPLNSEKRTFERGGGVGTVTPLPSFTKTLQEEFKVTVRTVPTSLGPSLNRTLSKNSPRCV